MPWLPPIQDGCIDLLLRKVGESCRIVGTPGFYPDRKVDVSYIEHFAPVIGRNAAQMSMARQLPRRPTPQAQ